MNSHLTAERNFEHLRRSRTLVKGILALKRKLPSEQGRIKFSHQSLERARFRDTFPSLSVIQTGSKNGRSPDAPPYDPRCAEWNDEQEEFAWQRAYKLHKELFKTERTLQRCPQNKLLQQLCPYKTIGLSSTILDIQIADGCVVSDTQGKVYIKELDAYLWIHLAKDSSSVLSLGKLCHELGDSYSWPTRNPHK